MVQVTQIWIRKGDKISLSLLNRERNAQQCRFPWIVAITFRIDRTRSREAVSGFSLQSGFRTESMSSVVILSTGMASQPKSASVRRAM